MSDLIELLRLLIELTAAIGAVLAARRAARAVRHIDRIPERVQASADDRANVLQNGPKRAPQGQTPPLP